MLSYRHGYHAGNHADVLKHWVQVLCLEYLKQKEKPFYYVDSHAGGGLYDLKSQFAQKTNEAAEGITCLWQQSDQPDVLADYIDAVAQFNPHKLKNYPGSPAIAANLLRESDRLRLVELHSAEISALQKQFAKDRRVKVIDGDGFQELKALLPPPTRRGLVLMDPPYEMKADYQRVIGAMKENLKRFANGIYLIWYPLINSVAAQRYSEQLRKLPCDKWLDVQLSVARPPQGHGMYGSGIFVVNPPWVLEEQLHSGLDYLVKKLAQDEAAESRILSSENH